MSYAFPQNPNPAYRDGIWYQFTDEFLEYCNNGCINRQQCLEQKYGKQLPTMALDELTNQRCDCLTMFNEKKNRNAETIEVVKYVDVPREVVKEVSVDVPVEVEKIVSVDVPYEVEKMVSVDVPVEIVKTISVDVPRDVIREVSVDVPYEVVKEVSVVIDNSEKIDGILSAVKGMSVRVDSLERISEQQLQAINGIDQRLERISERQDKPMQIEQPIKIVFA